ncbi:hypothetical protein RMO59_16265, partial [Streptomyces alfalfae]
MKTTGAHRAHRDARKRGASRQAPRTTPHGRYEPCLDGLFTYCLSVLCDHDAATAALSDVLHIAERRGSRGPASDGELKAWLYALARWVCLRRLAEARRSRHAAHASGGARAPKDAPRPAGPTPESADPSAKTAKTAQPPKPPTQAPRAPVTHSADYLDHPHTPPTAEHITAIGPAHYGAQNFPDPSPQTTSPRPRTNEEWSRARPPQPH